MTIKYKLFDSVKLKEAIPLTDGGMAEAGTVGAIVVGINTVKIKQRKSNLYKAPRWVSLDRIRWYGV
ncbi:MAG: hypothetical protein QNJ53_17260 [Pleurocapsa sp. MO_192.B19]|nr:hypothetical protein [Pleurocapsa sp. MO_192.B19]